MYFSILQPFLNVYYTTTVISKYLIDSYCHCRARTEVAKRVLAFDSLCRVQTGVAKHVLAFDSLRTGLVIVTSNVYSVFV